MTDAIEGVAQTARRKELRVAVAESLTCGLLAGSIGKGSAAEHWFAGGIVAYQTRTKVAVLGVRPGLDPVSGECAEQMAAGARELLQSDLAVSTTGVGGPGSEDGHPAGSVYLGWATAEGAGHVALTIDAGDPAGILDGTVAEAISLLSDLVDRA
jgi:nicotinamide-nucleotide amidase